MVPKTRMQTVEGGRVSRSPGSTTESSRESVRHYYFPTFNALPADAPIGRDVDPTAFLRVYTSHLEEDDEPIFREDEDSQMAERDDEDDEEDGGEPGETISRRELEAQIRQAAKEKVVFQAPLDATMDDG